MLLAVRALLGEAQLSFQGGEGVGSTAFCRAALTCCTRLCASRIRGARVLLGFYRSRTPELLRKAANRHQLLLFIDLSVWLSALAFAATGCSPPGPVRTPGLVEDQ